MKQKYFLSDGTIFSSRCAVASLVLVALSGSASADLISQGGGDYNAEPLYRGLAFSTVNFGANNAPINGIDYASNGGPLTPLATGNTNVVYNGATFSAVGQSVSSGFYAARNYASLSVSNANPNDTYYVVAGQGSATTVQFFSPNAAVDHAVFNWHVGGVTSNPGNIPPTVNGNVGPATGRLDFGASTDPNVHWLSLFEEDLSQSSSGGALNSIREFGPGSYSYTLPSVSLGTPIDLFYWSSAFAEVDAGQTALTNYTLTADYYNTAVLENVELFDVDGGLITDWSLQDVTDPNNPIPLYDQTGRLWTVESAPSLEPLPPLSGIPEPSVLALLAIGFTGLRWSGRNRQRV